MQKIAMISLVLLALIMTACSSQDVLIFQDQSENWSVEYKARIIAEDEQAETLRLAYRGEGEPPDTIDYEYETLTGSGDAHNATLENGVMERAEDACSGCATTSKDEEITVTVEWDGQKETFSLKPRSDS